MGNSIGSLVTCAHHVFESTEWKRERQPGLEKFSQSLAEILTKQRGLSPISYVLPCHWNSCDESIAESE